MLKVGNEEKHGSNFIRLLVTKTVVIHMGLSTEPRRHTQIVKEETETFW